MNKGEIVKRMRQLRTRYVDDLKRHGLKPEKYWRVKREDELYRLRKKGDEYTELTGELTFQPEEWDDDE